MTVVAADTTGSFNTSFTVTGATTSTDMVIAIDDYLNRAFAAFTPAVSLDQPTGIVGTSVTISGTSFSANESGIKVIFNDSQIGSTITANSVGAGT